MVEIDRANHLFDGQASEVGDALARPADGFLMREAVIVSAVRTPVGKAPDGTLRTTRPDEMAAEVIKAAMARAPGVSPEDIDDVIVGCAMPEAEQGLNVARIASLRAGLPVSAAAVTVNRFCASGLQAVAYAAERIIAGGADAIIAGGTESMSLVPMGGNKVSPNPALVDSYPDVYLTTGLVAENHARECGITREEQDAFALRSHERALAAQRRRPLRGRDRAAHSCASIAGQHRDAFAQDEGPRRDTSAAALAKLRPAFHAQGTVTAGNSSQTSDGASALLVTSAEFAKEHGLTPLARFVAYATAGVQAGALRHRPRAGGPQGTQARRPVTRSDRPRRAERGVRRASARVSARSCRSTRIASTSTAARSRSATPSAAPAPS